MDNSVKAIKKELDTAFQEFTERKMDSEDPVLKSFDDLLDVVQTGKVNKDDFMEKLSKFQYEAEAEAFDSGFQTCINILNNHTTNK